MTTQLDQAIHVLGLEKSYNQLEVLRGVDFDVARGINHFWHQTVPANAREQLLEFGKVEYVEKQPTLEDVFLAIVGPVATARTATLAMTAASARTSK
jgi:hypothetical protein